MSIRIRRDTRQHSQQTVQLEVHDECRCMCKVKADDCNPLTHRYREDLCNCECINSDQEQDCRSMGPDKFWDTESCMCKCRHQIHCSSGLRFSHDTCR